MRRITVATISVAASLALAACAERDSTSPRNASPGSASFAGRGGSSSCNFTTVNSTAQDYFVFHSGPTKDPVFGMISAMSDAFNTPSNNYVAATPSGWQILGRVAAVRLTDTVTTSQAGAAFVVAVAGCMADLATSANPLSLGALTDNSNLLLVRVLNSGIFEVRTGGSTGRPAVGKNLAGGVRALGSPVWGVEPLNSEALWPGLIQYAVIGYPIKDANPLLNSAPQVDQADDLGLDGGAYQTTGVWPFNAFELLTVPAGAFSDADHANLRVGLCVDGNPDGIGNVNFLVHSDVSLVPNSTPTQICATGFTGSVGNALPWYTRLARSAGGFFRPGILYAEGEDSRDFIGGLPSGWSPFHGGTLNVTNLTFKITTPPKNNVANFKDNSLVVTATVTSTGTPVPQVSVDSIVVFNNNGTPAGAVIVPGTTNLAELTDGTGNATVTFQIGKPGAYILVVWGSLDGAKFNAATGKFNVKNQ